jgi:hypothetical protein
MYGYVYSSVANADSFQGGTSAAGSVIAGFLAVAVIIAIQLFIVQYLWNNVLVRCVSVVKPLKSLLETLGLLILLAFLMPGCVV